MKKYILIFGALLLTNVHVKAQDSTGDIQRSYFKLTSSNGLVVAVYNAKENRIDDIYPHIFANYSGIWISWLNKETALRSAVSPFLKIRFRICPCASGERKNAIIPVTGRILNMMISDCSSSPVLSVWKRLE